MLQEESQMDIDDEQHDHNRVRYFVLIIRNVQVEDRGGFVTFCTYLTHDFL